MQCVWPAWTYGMLEYSRDELLKFQGNNNISRSVRKTLFRYNIWCPKTRRLVLKPRVSTKRTFQAVKGGLLNTRSINEKESSICELITDNQLDLLALTETWCTDKSSVSLGLIQPSGYSVIHLPRQDRRGGGVGLLALSWFIQSKTCESWKILIIWTSNCFPLMWYRTIIGYLCLFKFRCIHTGFFFSIQWTNQFSTD